MLRRDKKRSAKATGQVSQLDVQNDRQVEAQARNNREPNNDLDAQKLTIVNTNDTRDVEDHNQNNRLPSQSSVDQDESKASESSHSSISKEFPSKSQDDSDSNLSLSISCELRLRTPSPNRAFSETERDTHRVNISKKHRKRLSINSNNVQRRRNKRAAHNEESSSRKRRHVYTSGKSREPPSRIVSHARMDNNHRPTRRVSKQKPNQAPRTRSQSKRT